MDERQRQQVMARIKDQLIPLKVIEVNRRRRRLVLSQREAQKEWQESRKEVLIENLHVGERRVGRVSGLRDFGAFVDLGGADGLIHISELAWHRVNHPREVLRIGQEIEVFVLDLDKGEQRIALSRKRLLPSPWSLAGEKYTINQLVEGKISRIVDYGAFVEVEPGIEGLLHVSQLSRETVQDPRQILQEGETHLLRVISLDTEKQRIGLSLKSVSANEQIQWMAMREAEAEVERAEAEAAAAASEAESRAMVADQPEAVAVTEEPEPESEVEPAAVASTEVESAAAEGAETPSVELVEETTPRAEDHDVEVTAEEPGEAEAVEAEAAEMAADQAATAEELEVETPAETDMMVTENELVEPVEMDEEE
jgi:small subunit ribosomal protein S1